MGYSVPFLVLLVALLVSGIGYFILRDGELPEIPDEFWGPKSTAKEASTSIKPFHINISEKVLTDLRTRLALEVSTVDERLVEPLESVGFEYGFNKNFLKKVTSHWLNKYDWREREKALNKYPSFKTKISGIDIHFQHIKGTKKYAGGSRPILLLHGWPGSFVEYQKLIPLLVDSKNSEVNLELVIPSLPGFGFSEGARKPGLGAAEMSRIFLKLMNRLGYNKFYVHGTDWGSLIASNIATLYSDNVLGIHMTMCTSVHPRALLKFGAALALPQLLMSPEEAQQYLPVTRLITKLARELGYFYLQSTKPDTIGIALSNSPSGLAAYILEKFSFWTNQNWLNKEDGGISSHYDLNELLDNIMVHWVTSGVTTGMRIYAETFNPFTSNQFALDRVPTKVPSSCYNPPEELLSQPQFPLTEKYSNLVRYTNAKKGGHFSTLEVPELVASDILETIKTFLELERISTKNAKIN